MKISKNIWFQKKKLMRQGVRTHINIAALRRPQTRKWVLGNNTLMESWWSPTRESWSQTANDWSMGHWWDRALYYWWNYHTQHQSRGGERARVKIDTAIIMRSKRSRHKHLTGFFSFSGSLMLRYLHQIL